MFSSSTGIFGALIFALGFVAFTGYFLQAEEMYGWGKLTRMAIHTAAGFIIISTGIYTLALSLEKRVSSETPKWVFINIGIISITVTLSLLQALTAGAYILAMTIISISFIFVIGAYTFKDVVLGYEKEQAENVTLSSRLKSSLLFFQYSIQWKIIVFTIIPIALIYLVFLGYTFSSLESSSSKHEEEQLLETNITNCHIT